MTSIRAREPRRPNPDEDERVRAGTSAMSGAAETAARSAEKAARIAAWAALASAVISILGIIVGGFIAYGTARDLADRDRRLQAYGALIEELESNAEFVWNQVNWASDVNPSTGVATPPDSAAFWAESSRFQASLKSKYEIATIVAESPDVEDSLDRLHGERTEMWADFKCMAVLDACNDESHEQYNGDIQAMLLAWDKRKETMVDELVDAIEHEPGPPLLTWR